MLGSPCEWSAPTRPQGRRSRSGQPSAEKGGARSVRRAAEGTGRMSCPSDGAPCRFRLALWGRGTGRCGRERTGTGRMVRAGTASGPAARPDMPYGEKETVSGISVIPLYFSIASFMRLSLWPSRLFHSAHQLRKFLKVESGSARIPK